MRLAIVALAICIVGINAQCTDVTDQIATTGTVMTSDLSEALITVNQTQDGVNTGSFEIRIGGGRRYLRIDGVGANGPTFDGTLVCVNCGGTVFNVPSAEAATIDKISHNSLRVCLFDDLGADTCSTLSYRLSGAVTATDVTDRDVTFSRTCH